MILACQNIKKSFGEDVIVSSGSFHIEDREKAALVGPNGAGKSTILKMIVGELPSDGGDILLAKGKTLGYLAQHQEMNTGATIYEEVQFCKRTDLRNGAKDPPTRNRYETPDWRRTYPVLWNSTTDWCLSLNLKMDTPVKVRSSGF